MNQIGNSAPWPEGEWPYRSRSVCTEPALHQQLTGYCFGDLPEGERTAIEVHLLDCDVCWREVKQLTAAVEAMRADKDLIRSISVEEACSMLGISAKLDWPMGGHVFHAVLCACLYALTYSFGLISEIAYVFDRYGRTATWVSPLVFAWVCLTTIGALALDWKATERGKSGGLRLSIAVTIIAAAALVASLSFFLPNFPVTQMDTPAQTAQGGYLKGVVYVLPVAFVFLLVPFHFVLAMQRELQEGRYRLALALLSSDKRAVSPEGSIHISVRTLWILLVAAFLLSIPLTAGLFGHVKTSPYLGIFTLFIYLRWLAYFGLGLVCLFWYSRLLNELKRECLAAERVSF
jgi:hypothetical protein